jgi:hypothetical protein
MWKHITLERNEKELQAQELPKTWKHEIGMKEAFECETS